MTDRAGLIEQHNAVCPPCRHTWRANFRYEWPKCPKCGAGALEERRALSERPTVDKPGTAGVVGGTNAWLPEQRPEVEAWISVDESLPSDHCGKFLVTNNIEARDAFGFMSHVWLATLLHHDDERGWYAFDDYDQRVPQNITHWMPLPVTLDRSQLAPTRAAAQVCMEVMNHPPTLTCDGQYNTKAAAPAQMPELSYGELMMLTEGHNTSVIYERFLALRAYAEQAESRLADIVSKAQDKL